MGWDWIAAIILLVCSGGSFWMGWIMGHTRGETIASRRTQKYEKRLRDFLDRQVADG